MKTRNFKKHLILPIIIACVCAFTACGSSASPNGTASGVDSQTTTQANITLDINAISQEIISSGAFSDTLEPIDASYIEMLMKIAPADYSASVINMGSGATAERLALFETADNTAALALKAKCDQHIAEQIEAYAGYKPEEVDKINKAIVKVTDKYVILCIAGNYDAAGQIIDKYFN